MLSANIPTTHAIHSHSRAGSESHLLNRILAEQQATDTENTESREMTAF
jgi:hypothetical protein